MQVNHIKPRPFILLGQAMFDPLIKYMEEVPAAVNLMNRDDLKMIKIVDTVEDVVRVLEPHIAHFRKLHAEDSQNRAGPKQK